jgi:hypothetical protein
LKAQQHDETLISSVNAEYYLEEWCCIFLPTVQQQWIAGSCSAKPKISVDGQQPKVVHFTSTKQQNERSDETRYHQDAESNTHGSVEGK